MHHQPPDKPHLQRSQNETRMSVQLEPLSELTPPRRTPMDPKDMGRLAFVRVELKWPLLLYVGVEANKRSGP
jgi:hypothetical protein